MNLLNSFSTAFINTMEKRAAARMWEYLQSMDAAMLDRAGVSRELLAQGPSAYPWRMTNTVTAPGSQTLDTSSSTEHNVTVRSFNKHKVEGSDLHEAMSAHQSGDETYVDDQDQQAAA